MSKKLYSLFFLPILLSSTATSKMETKVQGNSVFIYNSTEAKAEGNNVTAESNVSTTINGENVTVKTDQPGSVEVKNINGKVEIKTSDGITPTIIITGIPAGTENVKQEIKIEEEKSASPTAFSKIMNKQTRSIYTFFKGFFSRVFKPFLRKT